MKENWCIPRWSQTSSSVRGRRKCSLCSISVGYGNTIHGMHICCSQGPIFTYTGDIHFAFWNTWTIFTRVTVSLKEGLLLLCQCDAVPVLQQSRSVCFNGNWQPTSTLIDLKVRRELPINCAFSQAWPCNILVAEMQQDGWILISVYLAEISHWTWFAQTETLHSDPIESSFQHAKEALH